MDHAGAAAKIIRENRYLTLATAGSDGPWAAPLAYTVEGHDLIFYSATSSRHCQHLNENPSGSISIFNSTEPSSVVDGVQAYVTVSIVGPSDLPAIMERYFINSFPNPEERKAWVRPASDFKGDAPQRFYRMALREINKPDPDSQKIDRRIQVDLERVKELISR